MIAAAGLVRGIDAGWRRLLDGQGTLLPAAALAVNFVLMIVTNRSTLQDFPLVNDEYVYHLQAMTYAEGRLSVPSPDPAKFFDYPHVLNDGRFYGKYTPGWPLLLSVGYLAGSPWLVNPILSILTFVLIYRTALDFFGSDVARVAVLSMTANPCFVFHSSGYYAHPSCLLFLSIFVYGFFAALRDPSKPLPFALMGAGLGAALLIRSYTAIGALAPLCAWLAWHAWKSGQVRAFARGLPLALILPAAAVGSILYYDYLLTGDPFLQPFLKYQPLDRPRLLMSLPEVGNMLRVNVFERLLELLTALPLSLLFLFLFFYHPELRRDRGGRLLVLLFGGQFVAFMFYWFHGFDLYGPRYLYEALGAVVIVSALVLTRIGWMGGVLLAVVLAFNVGHFVQSTRFYSGFVRDGREMYEVVERAQIRDAIVFMKMNSGALPPKDLARNGIHFDGPVLYVPDRGPQNRELLMKFPERKAYLWEFDARLKKGRVTPYSAERQAGS